MKTMHDYTGVIVKAERGTNTPDGNPRHIVTIECDDGMARTFPVAADHAVAFEITNYVAEGDIRPTVTLHIGSYSTVESMTALTEDRGTLAIEGAA